MDDAWKEIPGYDGYEASKSGYIRSYWKKNAGPIPKKNEIPQLLTFTKGKSGYLKVKIGGETQTVHKIILITFSGFPEDGQMCRHLDGVKTNNNIKNLKWGTPKENSDDTLLHNKRILGESHYCSRLSNKQIEDIRESNKSDKELSEIYNVTKGHIYKIKINTKRNNGIKNKKLRGLYKKLTDNEIDEIRHSNEKQVDLAKKYGVCQAHISRIKLNKARKGI